MNESVGSLAAYRAWLARRIDDVLARPSAHAATPAEAEITLVTLMESYVAAWSTERGRSPDKDVARVVGLWRAACVRLRGPGVEHARLGSLPAHEPAVPLRDDAVRLLDGMSRVWEDVQAMCPSGTR